MAYRGRSAGRPARKKANGKKTFKSKSRTGKTVTKVYIPKKGKKVKTLSMTYYSAPKKGGAKKPAYRVTVVKTKVFRSAKSAIRARRTGNL